MTALQRPRRRLAPAPTSIHTLANLVPSVARAVVGLIEERGLSAERLCRGLGFTDQDLLNADTRLSFHQTRLLILRAQQLLGEPACGLAAGARQTPTSWGLVGLAMLTCETLGKAITFALFHQSEGGAMVEHLCDVQGQEIIFEAVPRIFDRRIEPFLVEGSFAAAINVSRCLVGRPLNPVRVEFAFPLQGPQEVYDRFFCCPVRFGAPRNLMAVSAHWADTRLPGYDRLTSGLLRQQLRALFERPPGRDDLVESLASRIRSGIEGRPRQRDLAREVNVSERTLRRLLGERDVGFRQLRDDALYERARDLLSHSPMTVSQVAQALGYSDARAFRRAFKRWSGRLPTEFRRHETPRSMT